MSKLFSICEAAIICHISPDYLRHLCQTGKIKAKKVGRDWVLREFDVKNYCKQRDINKKEA